MSNLIDEGTMLDILEEFQHYIFFKVKRMLTADEIQDFVDEYLDDLSFLEE